MSESFEAIGGGTSASPEVSTAAVPVEEGGGGTPLDDAPLGEKEQLSTKHPSDEERWHL